MIWARRGIGRCRMKGTMTNPSLLSCPHHKHRPSALCHRTPCRLFSSSINKETTNPSYPPPPAGNAKSHVVPPEVDVKVEKERSRDEKIKKLKEEIRRGYFYELGQVNKTSSKVWCQCLAVF